MITYGEKTIDSKASLFGDLAMSSSEAHEKHPCFLSEVLEYLYSNSEERSATIALSFWYLRGNEIVE
jgi:hypothetical protein